MDPIQKEYIAEFGGERGAWRLLVAQKHQQLPTEDQIRPVKVAVRAGCNFRSVFRRGNR
jgi:hypothetical protein